jgi:hypothetical protein
VPGVDDRRVKEHEWSIAGPCLRYASADHNEQRNSKQAIQRTFIQQTYYEPSAGCGSKAVQIELRPICLEKRTSAAKAVKRGFLWHG